MPGAGPEHLVHHSICVPGDAAGMRWVEEAQRPWWPGYETGAHVPGSYPPLMSPGHPVPGPHHLQMPPESTEPPGPGPWPGRGWPQGPPGAGPGAHDPNVRVDNLSSEVTNKAIEEFFWQAGVKTQQVVQSSAGGKMFAHIWLESPAMLGQALGLNGKVLQGQSVLVQDCRAGAVPPASSGAHASHMQGFQEGKGKGWSKGAYPAGAPAASSMSWQQPPREKPGGEAPSPERDQDKDQDRQKPHEVKPKTATPPVCPVVPESSEPPETTAVYCPECQTWLNGPRQWEDRKIGKKHRKNVQKQRAGSASGTTKQQGASPKKANEPIVAPPEYEETANKSEMANWLNNGVDEIVKSQAREGGKPKVADDESESDPNSKRSRRSRRRKNFKDGDEGKGETSGPDPGSQANDDNESAVDDDDDQENVPQTLAVDVEAPPALQQHCQAALVLTN